ncbi:MAG: amidohydrolase family protein [Vicingaceae bacterium]
MKKISADYIFPGNASPIKNGVVIYDSKGRIDAVLNPEIDAINWDDVEIFDGLICPGFVNTHCHLELSHLKGKINEATELHGFVKEIVAVRNNASEQEKLTAIDLANNEMIDNGIVAVGDIANGNSTFSCKEKSVISYHTFLEVFSLNPAMANDAINNANILKSSYHNNNISITPHSPYSLSEELSSMVNNESGNILTIHNQETASENELFLKKSGKLYNQLSSFSEDIKNWVPTGKNSLPSYLPNYNSDKKILLVHNTFTNSEDIAYAKEYSSNIYWCFCPNANEYIESKQPDYSLFKNEKCTIGTDSLASNWSLSVLDELKTISKKNATISLETLIKWATFNGAQFLGFNLLGSIEKGKTPGLNLITNLNGMKLADNSSIKKII